MGGRVVAAALASVAVALGTLATVSAVGGGAAAAPVPEPAASAISDEQVARVLVRRGGVPVRGPLGARIVRDVLLREEPGGRIVHAIGPRTEFGSPRVLAVVEQRPGWLAVLSHLMPNSRPGWIPDNAAELLFEPYSLLADLSERTLVVRREGRVARRITVATGGAATPTPTGRFAVTDVLRTGDPGGAYGCCVLALSGHVPHGWSNGDRLAIHGTPDEGSLGTPASRGCLRAGADDMRWLLANVPRGAPLLVTR